MSRKKLTDIQVSKMIQEYKNGLFMRELARKYNVSNTTIKNYLKGSGIEIKETNEEIKRSARSRTGEKNPMYKQGKRTHERGYIWVNIGPNKYKLEHRLVMEQKLGRELRKDEHIHHINGIKNDNRIENLQIMTHSEHSTITGLEKGDTFIVSKEDLRNLIASGKRYKEISKMYGFSTRTFFNRLERYNLKEFYKGMKKI